MRNRKSIVIASIAGVLFAVIGGFVVYAAISSQLNINGSAEFQPESWSVKFKASSLSTPTKANGGLTGTAAIDTAPTLTDTVIEEFKIVLKQPGDSAKYTFDIENTGTLDAELSTLTETTPTCTGTGATASADEGIVCGANLSYTMKYIGGDLATNGLTQDSAVTANDKLKANTSVQVELKLSYSSSATQNPTAAVSIGGLNKTLIYTVDGE